MFAKQLIKFEIFVIFFYVLSSRNLINAKSGWVYKNEVESKICYNPNNNLGVCMPMKECAAFNYVLRNNLKENYKFFWDSRCERETGNPPCICCTNDIQFREQKFEESVNENERIIFPDELERIKKAVTMNLSIESSTTKITETAVSNIVTESIKCEKERIIFPDELEKVKKIINKNVSMSQRMVSSTTVSTERTVLSTVKSTESPFSESTTVIESTELTERVQIPQNQTYLFPKPPKCGNIVVSNKIYGGHDTDLSEFSWMVILEYRNQTTGQLLMDCAGSLINDRYALTAAHCVKGDILRIIGKLESVRVGEHNTETEKDCNESGCLEPFQRIAIESITPHPDFQFKSYFGTRNQHDIALLRLKKAVKFNEFIQPICLPNVISLEALEESTKFVVAGWGHNGTMVRTAVKQKLELPLVKHEKCRAAYGKKFYLADEQLCAGGRFREDSCNGDSGGPLMRICNDFWVIEGIVSFGLKCGLEQPGVYTNVRHYLEWIKENVNK